ncbi:farnesyl-diphosphate synthase [Haematobacter massiliensis]|uniref:Geranylgeranyl diphosphate synthase n=1 Tax=Haematobacter massiliensis TaxID=195105 RepID=A0A086Y885_9RHOB|nr:farnesyl diphosphate synthase [Haematobacter massiliensis]KFI30485.1 farnesyl-diphosphate synthase [Haematobacter massiliensis]OWJ70960.1 farnesyl-diphosphate synthase [Haematobacter massiliensis]OWJ87500.1 farnesyl-diphosphate synthase [Haematobacter massiliensis]QBJ24955.1 polyprenyl synthetase family protein [Haematobacter massiliensis]
MFEEALRAAAERVEARLQAALSPIGDLPVIEAMRYAVSGGKRVRAFLVMEGARLHGIPPEQAVHAAAAVEAVHAYSLVHDDLPAMDDDDLRRGQPTVHVKWDEATAILAGDALQTLAFDLLSRPETAPDAATRLQLIAGLARATGAEGMVLGQAQDIAAETAARPLTLEEITVLQANKTGALFRWSAEAGPLLAGANPRPMRAYAEALGLAFQIADDILDAEGDPAKAGKRLRKDAEAGKATFVSLLGLDGARKRAISLVEEACAALTPYGDEAERLRDTARFVIAREM